MTSATTDATALTASTQFVQADGISFAYRRLGRPGGVPVVLINHFLGNLENFDPAISDDLARDREVILFDNAGVGLSTGRAPDSLEAMARDAAAFIDALGLTTVDLLGHSMGGEVAQQLLVDRPELIRRAALVGTGPRGGEGMSAQRADTAALFAKRYEHQDEMWLPIMFSPSEASQAAGRAWLDRTRARGHDRDVPVSDQTALAHRTAAGKWGAAAENSYAYLRDIDQPILVVNGSDDIVIATVNSCIMFQNLPNAQLILYPDAGHGAHFQYPSLFLGELRTFLDG